MTTENLNDFWEKSSDIPMETFDQNGDIITFETCVLNKWETDFENLYRNDDNSAFDSHFQNEALSHKQLREENMLDTLYDQSEYMYSRSRKNNHACKKRKVIRHR